MNDASDRKRNAPRAVAFPYQVAQGVRFYSRIPVPRLPGEADQHALPDFRTMPRALPFAALIIAAPACGVILLCAFLGLPSFLAAGFAIATLVLTTGAFHEDGLADVADGFGGGRTVERKLEIMKDSRIGAFGGVALSLSILLRVAALAALIQARPIGSVIALMAATAVLSRIAGLAPLAMLPAARYGGAAAEVGRPTLTTLIVAVAFAAVMTGIFAALAGWPPGLGAAMIAAAIAAGLFMTLVSARQIGGQTGDVAGAAQQVAEIACLTTPLLAVFS